MEASSSEIGVLGSAGYGAEIEGSAETAGLGIGGKEIREGGGMVLGTRAVVGLQVFLGDLVLLRADKDSDEGRILGVFVGRFCCSGG